MIYSILGYNQKELCELNITVRDALILKYITDFMKTGKMVTIKHKGQTYYWVDYKAAVASLPILNIKKDMLYRRLKELVKVGVLKHYTKREGGTFPFYALGDKYENLIYKGNGEENKKDEKVKNIKEDTLDTNENENTSKYYNKKKRNTYKKTVDNKTEDNKLKDQLPEEYSKSNIKEIYPEGKENNKEGYGKKSLGPQDINSEGYVKNYGTKDYIIKDSLNNNSLNKNKDLRSIVKEVIDYLNSSCNKKFKVNCKTTCKLIDKLIGEGYRVSDFKKVIDTKSTEWIGTKFWEYIRPSTLFGEKFYDYVKEEIEFKGFNNFVPRQYDYDDLERKLLGWD